MRRAVAGAVATAAMAAGLAVTGTAQADPVTSGGCAGEIVAGIASTWPWAHEGRGMEYAPPPGAIALWIQVFGPEMGISSVRELEVMFCSEG